MKHTHAMGPTFVDHAHGHGWRGWESGNYPNHHHEVGSSRYRELLLAAKRKREAANARAAEDQHE